MILRNRDANTAWTTASDATLEEVRYYCQNYRGDVAAILTGGGRMAEWARYSSYGVPWAMPAGDTDSDGDWDATDEAAITGGYEVRKDAGLDGSVSADDVTRANAITGGYQTLGREFLTSTGVKNRIAYAGYQYDPTFAGLDRHLFHVRHRIYDAEAGRWTRRDPMGYVDGLSAYLYAGQGNLQWTDPHGLAGAICGVYKSLSGACLPRALPPVSTPNPVMPPNWHPGRVPGLYPGPPYPGSIPPAVATCLKDPDVQYWYDVVTYVCGSPVTIVQGGPDCSGKNGYYCCTTNTVHLCPGWDCTTVVHELFHAYQDCTNPTYCSNISPCGTMMIPGVKGGGQCCLEIQAFAIQHRAFLCPLDIVERRKLMKSFISSYGVCKPPILPEADLDAMIDQCMTVITCE